MATQLSLSISTQGRVANTNLIKEVIDQQFASDLLVAFSAERIIYIQDNCGSRILSHLRLFQYTEYHLSLAKL